jgi:gluconate 5-dehydrogenase
MTQTLFDLSGRTALVTGSSRGIGRAIAEGMAKGGARLIINGTDPARVETAVTEFRAAGHVAEGAAFDVTNEAGIVRAFEDFDGGIRAGLLPIFAGIFYAAGVRELGSAGPEMCQYGGTFCDRPHYLLVAAGLAAAWGAFVSVR